MNKVKDEYTQLRAGVDSAIINFNKFSELGVKKSATDLRKDLKQIMDTAKAMRKDISDAKATMKKKPGKKETKKPSKKSAKKESDED